MAKSQAEIFNLQGILLQEDAFVIIVKTAWNALNVDRLQEGCERVLQLAGVAYRVLEVPGAVEIPFAIRHHARVAKKAAHAYIALGCVIKGDTPHFEYVCNSVTDGITQLNLDLEAPVVFGVLTLLNQQQAEERLGGPHGHKGEEAAATAIKMIALKQTLKHEF